MNFVFSAILFLDKDIVSLIQCCLCVRTFVCFVLLMDWSAQIFFYVAVDAAAVSNNVQAEDAFDLTSQKSTVNIVHVCIIVLCSQWTFGLGELALLLLVRGLMQLLLLFTLSPYPTVSTAYSFILSCFLVFFSWLQHL